MTLYQLKILCSNGIFLEEDGEYQVLTYCKKVCGYSTETLRPSCEALRPRCTSVNVVLTFPPHSKSTTTAVRVYLRSKRNHSQPSHIFCMLHRLNNLQSSVTNIHTLATSNCKMQHAVTPVSAAGIPVKFFYEKLFAITFSTPGTTSMCISFFATRFSIVP
jgi:hypothetical protein